MAAWASEGPNGPNLPPDADFIRPGRKHTPQTTDSDTQERRGEEKEREKYRGSVSDGEGERMWDKEERTERVEKGG